MAWYFVLVPKTSVIVHQLFSSSSDVQFRGLGQAYDFLKWTNYSRVQISENPLIMRKTGTRTNFSTAVVSKIDWFPFPPLSPDVYDSQWNYFIIGTGTSLRTCILKNVAAHIAFFQFTAKNAAFNCFSVTFHSCSDFVLVIQHCFHVW